ncbi:hypothetical protein C8T65DRAFT_182229 [Cerioporus squamosus]|nr:hypothetical protein C8T65DRAFT_182229 [Cerioporus squamosus]
MATTSIARPPALPAPSPWSSYTWNTCVTTSALAVPASEARKRVREEDADIPESKRVRICPDAASSAQWATTCVGRDDAFSGAPDSHQTTGFFDTWEITSDFPGECHSDHNKATLSEPGASSLTTEPLGSWTWTSVHGIELPALQRESQEADASHNESAQLEEVFSWISSTTPSTEYPMTPAPALEPSSPDVIPSRLNTASRRLPWKQRRPGSSPLRQSTTSDELSNMHDCMLDGRPRRAPAPLDDERCSFRRSFLKERAHFRRKRPTCEESDAAFRCTLEDEDPKLPLRGTPSHAREELQPLNLPPSHQYYKYTTGPAARRLTHVEKLSGAHFRGHGAQFARPAPSKVARPLADRISVHQRVSLQLALLGHGGGTVTVTADETAVASWVSHVEMVPILKMLKTIEGEELDMTTGHLVYIEETLQLPPLYSGSPPDTVTFF